MIQPLPHDADHVWVKWAAPRIHPRLLQRGDRVACTRKGWWATRRGCMKISRLPRACPRIQAYSLQVLRPRTATPAITHPQYS